MTNQLLPVAREAGRFAPALAELKSFDLVFAEASAERARLLRVGDHDGADSIAVITAESARRTGRLPLARATLAATMAAGDPSGTGVRWAKWSAGNLLRQTGERARSATLFQQAMAAAHAAGDIWLELYVTAGQAETLRIAGRYTAAEAAHRSLLGAFQALGDLRGTIWAWEGLAQIALKTRRLLRAQDLFRRALDASERHDDMRGLGFAHRGLAETALAAGALDRARAHGDAATEIFGDAAYAVGEGYTRKSLAEIFLQLGDLDRARDELALSRERFVSAGDTRGLLYDDLLALRVAGIDATRTNRREAAQALVRRVQESGLILARVELWKELQRD